jgi:hypothetical protein
MTLQVLTPHNGSRNPAKIARKSRQERAIVALVLGKSVTVAAAQAGVSRWTVYEWMKQPDFRASLEAAAREQAMLTRLGLDAIAIAAEGNVCEVLRKAHTPKKRVYALQRILDLYEGLEDRIERRLAQKPPRPRLEIAPEKVQEPPDCGTLAS